MTTDIFSFTDYRSYLKDAAESFETTWGVWTKFAKAAGCQTPYLSQVMKEKAHLTADHVIGLAEFLRLNEDETEFFFLLLDLGRAGTPKLRKHLSARMAKIRKARENLSERLKKPRFETQQTESLYYSAWFWSAMHVIVSIPEFQTTAAIANRLMLPVDFIHNALEKLEELGIVNRDGEKWKHGAADIHVPKNSPMVSVHHQNWRQRAVADSMLPMHDGVHYTAVYSISRTDFEKLKARMLEMIEYSRVLIGPSKEEELIAFTCDIFRV